MKFPWQRRVTVPRLETRESTVETIAPYTGAPIRATYPMSDASSQVAFKRFDVANRARKITLYQTYLGESWISACVEAIAGRIVSGGWTLADLETTGSPEVRSRVLEFLNWCNPDEDLGDILHDGTQDLLWSGEMYFEVTWKPSMVLGRDVPYEIYTVDAISMDYEIDPATKKSIHQYVQTTDTGDKINLDPRQIFRVWFPDPRNRLRALSPIEKLLNPVTWDTYIQLSEQKFHEQGNRGNLVITTTDGDQAEGARLLKWIREKYTGVKNAHLPLVLYGNVDAKEAKGYDSVDILARRKFARDEILAVYKVPPHLVSVVESNGMGQGGLSDTLEKQFVHTAVDPVRSRVLKPFNFKVIGRGFGTTAFGVQTTYADLRDTREITDIQTKRVSFGLATINDIRSENGDARVDGGDTPVLLTSRGPLPISDLPRASLLQTLGGVGIGTDASAPVTKTREFGNLNPADSSSEPTSVRPSQVGGSAADISKGGSTSEDESKELDFWETVATRRVRDGKKFKPWTSTVLSPTLVETLNTRLEGVTSVDGVHAVFHMNTLPKWLVDHARRSSEEIAVYHRDLTDRIAREYEVDQR